MKQSINGRWRNPQPLPGPFKYLDIFVSFATEDKTSADYYRRLFDDFSVFAYHRAGSMLPGASRNTNLEAQIKRNIEECDFFILLVSDHSMSKPWCARELGLALKLQKERLRKGGTTKRALRPFIIPIFLKDMVWRQTNAKRPTHFPVLDFETEKVEKQFRFLGHDPHARPRARSDGDLVKAMRPYLHKLRGNIHSERELAQMGVSDLYRAMFHKNELDPFEDIVNWALKESVGVERSVYIPRAPSAQQERFAQRRSTRSNKEKVSNKLDSLFYVVTLYDAPVAFCYVDYDYYSRLVAGNFLAVCSGWRSGDLACKVREAVEQDLAGMCGPQGKRYRPRGVLFLVEPIDFKKLRSFAESSSRQVKITKKHAIFKQARRLKRLAFYQKNLGATLYLDGATKRPLIYKDPCLDKRKPPAKWKALEEPYWIMWWTTLGETPPSWSEAVSFLCLEIQAKSMVITNPNQREPAFWTYAKDLNNSIVAQAAVGTVEMDILDIDKLHKRLASKIENWREIEI